MSTASLRLSQAHERNQATFSLKTPPPHSKTLQRDISKETPKRGEGISRKYTYQFRERLLQHVSYLKMLSNDPGPVEGTYLGTGGPIERGPFLNAPESA